MNSQLARMPVRSVPWGITLIYLGRIFFVLGPLGFFFALLWDDAKLLRSGSVPLFFSLIALPFAIGFGSAWLIRVGHRVATADPVLTLAHDSRRPILFLRPFTADGAARGEHDLDDDDNFGDVGNLVVESLSVVKPLRAFVKAYLATEDLTLEQELVRWLRGFGPVVAIGRPGESIQTAGAARLYASDEGWQNAVLELMDRAGIVIWHSGLSRGTQWELMELVRRVNPRRVLLIVPSPVRRPTSYMRVRELLNEVLPLEIPTLWEDINILSFDEKWAASAHAWKYLGADMKVMSSSGLDIAETLSEFMSKLPVTEITSTKQYIRPKSQLLQRASLWVAPVIGISACIAIGAALDALERRNDARAECEQLAAELDKPINVTYPKAWLERVDSARAAFRGDGRLMCVPSATLSSLNSEFERRLPAEASLLLPEWRNQVLDRAAALEEVTRALQAAGAYDLATKWVAEREVISRELTNRTIVLNVSFVHEPELVDFVKRDFESHIRKDLQDRIRELATEVRTPAGSTFVIANLSDVSNEAQLSFRSIDASVTVEYAVYGEEISPQVSESLHGWLQAIPISLTILARSTPTNGRGQAIAFMNTATQKAPESVSVSSIGLISANAVDKLVSQATGEWTKAIVMGH